MLWTLFFTFVKIGMFTIGGGYAMIPLIEREVVHRGWLGKEEFLDLFAVTQSLPGIFAVNISIFVGYKLKGVWGSVICALGTILPSFCIILLIAMFFNHFEDNPWVAKVFNGIRPAVVALIAVPCISAARSLHLKRVQLIAPAIGALLIWLCGVSPVWIINKHGWLTLQEFTEVVAISQMTPGPIGINSATYIGYTATGSVWGSVVATFAVCFPSFLLVLLISYFFARFKSNKYVAAAFEGLRPMTVGLIAAAGLLLVNHENFIDWKSVVIFAAAFFLTWRYKIHPILMICLAGAAGLFLYW